VKPKNGEAKMATGTVLYVYYKLDAAQHAALAPVVRSFQQRVSQTWPGLSCDLMQRPETSAEGKETWMEIYQHAGGLTDRMIESISRLALETQLPLPRLSEIFIPLR
jgi:hypothetical protein